MVSFPDRLRHWYEHERDSNAKMLAMLESVPQDRRSDPRFQQAVDLAVHLAIARENWLSRLEGTEDPTPEWFPIGTDLATLGARFDALERVWVEYLADLGEASLARGFEFAARGGRWAGTVECVLVQVNGHAWYHRGQISLLVSQLGGESVDTDFIFWSARNHGDPHPAG